MGLNNAVQIYMFTGLMSGKIAEVISTAVAVATVFTIGSVLLGKFVHGILLQKPTHEVLEDTFKSTNDVIKDVADERTYHGENVVEKEKRSASLILSNTTDILSEQLHKLKLKETKQTLLATTFFLSVIIGYSIGIV